MRFEPGPMLGVAVGKGKVIAVKVDIRRIILPFPLSNVDGPITVVNSIVVLVKKDYGTGRRRMLNVTLFHAAR